MGNKSRKSLFMLRVNQVVLWKELIDLTECYYRAGRGSVDRLAHWGDASHKPSVNYPPCSPSPL